MRQHSGQTLWALWLAHLSLAPLVWCLYDRGLRFWLGMSSGHFNATLRVHLLLTSALWLAALGLASLCVRRWPRCRKLLAAGLALLAGGVLSLYATHYFSNRNWGENTTFTLLAAYAKHPQDTLQTFQISGGVLLAAGLTIAVLYALLFAFYLRRLEPAGNGGVSSRWESLCWTIAGILHLAGIHLLYWTQPVFALRLMLCGLGLTLLVYGLRSWVVSNQTLSAPFRTGAACLVALAGYAGLVWALRAAAWSIQLGRARNWVWLGLPLALWLALTVARRWGVIVAWQQRWAALPVRAWTPERVWLLLLLAYCVSLGSLWRSLQNDVEVRDYALFPREPFLSFFVPFKMQGAGTPEKLAIVKRDRDARAAYPKLPLPQRAPNVIIFLLDSLRADHTTPYGYQRPTTPFLQRLSDAGQLQKVDVAVSTTAGTFSSLFSLLSGQPFRDVTYDNFKAYDLLRDCGYRVNLLLSGNPNTWYLENTAFGQSDFFFTSDDAKTSANNDQLLLDGLARVPPFSGTPNFFYFHLMSPHATGLKQPEFRRWEPAGLNFQALLKGDDLSVSYSNNYDNGILQGDAYLAELWETLRAKGYMDNSFVIVTSDHGEGVSEQEGFSHFLNLRYHQTWIPLFFYDSTGRRLSNTQTATHIDLAPTIVERVGLPVPAIWPGQSLWHPPAERFTFHEAGTPAAKFRAVLYWQDKHLYKLHVAHDQTPRLQLFDLRADPWEQHALDMTANPVLVAKLRQAFEQHWSESMEHYAKPVGSRQ